MDRLTSMEVFVRVAEEDGFTAAARKLELSKSVVSKHVQSLEKYLGVRLFNRTTRRLSLTEAGTRYYERCVGIIDEVGEAERAVSSLYALPRGVLRVNAPVSFGILHLGPALPAFLRRYPDLQVDISLNDRYVDVVNEGFDVAVRIGRLEDSSLIARRVASSQAWLCASPDYLEANGTPSSPADLTAHNCLVYAYSRQPGGWFLRAPDGREHRLNVEGTLRANNGEFLLSAAVRGTGIVMMPDFICADAVHRGELVRLLPEYRTAELNISAVYPYARNVSAKVRAFVDFLAEEFGEGLKD
ncbi:MAG: LysR family transcriptional regulator [Ectothiorhodospiraceae bacterium]|jgi:DNA-binding transcriptional LysR family regulator